MHLPHSCEKPFFSLPFPCPREFKLSCLLPQLLRETQKDPVLPGLQIHLPKCFASLHVPGSVGEPPVAHTAALGGGQEEKSRLLMTSVVRRSQMCPCGGSPRLRKQHPWLVLLAVPELREHLSQDGCSCFLLPRGCLCRMLCGWDVVLSPLHCWTLFGHSARG